MEKELSSAMSLWEQAMTERDQKRLDEIRQNMARIAETIQALVLQELEIRRATEPLTSKSPDEKWAAVEEGQKNLHGDMEPALNAGLEDLKEDPMIQMALRGLFGKAADYMEDAANSLADREWTSSIQNEDQAIKTLLSASSRMQQMMKQLGQQAQFSRGSHRERGNYFKKTLNGPFEGPKEYRDALRRTLREERVSPLNEKERKFFYQRLIK